MEPAADFDRQAAFLRRFTADAQGNLAGFARRLKEAMPDRVTLHEKRGLFSRAATVTGVSVELGDHRYRLELAAGRLEASIAHVVRGIALSTRAVEPAEWFARLTDATGQASGHAEAVGRSLDAFMAG